MSESAGRPEDVADVVAGAARHFLAMTAVAHSASTLPTEKVLQVLEVARRLSSEREMGAAMKQLRQWVDSALLACETYDPEGRWKWPFCRGICTA